jgi:hypothetical protein
VRSGTLKREINTLYWDVGEEVALKNFAEELVYWYLRFNGFFPLMNFVLHSSDLVSSQSADADILGVRPKYAIEKIGEKHLDRRIFDHFEKNKTIGVICEVKSGQVIDSDILINRIDRLEYALKRIGFFSSPKIDKFSKILVSDPVIYGNFHQVGKLLFTHQRVNRPDFICINLIDVENFLLERIELFSREKDSAKLLFDSDMLQYMIWKQRNGRNG